MPASNVDKLRAYFKKHDLAIIEDNNITQNILQSLDSDSDKHTEEINRHVPWYLRKAFFDFVGIRNTGVYRIFNSGKYVYYHFLLIKL